jgi:ribosomal protein L30
MSGQIKVTLTGSVIGCTRKQKETVKSLGLNRRGRSRIIANTPATRGAITKVIHLVTFEEIAS